MNSYDVFILVVKLGGFSKAAKALHRSPSAISKQISALEQKLNSQLFDRTTRNLSLTEAGNIYYERCKEISQKIRDTEEELKDVSGEPSGKLRLTWSNSLSFSRIVTVLSEFSDCYPKIVFDIKITNENINLSDEKIDFAFRQGPLEDSSMIAIKLFDIEPVFCASPAFLKKHGAPKNMLELLKLPLAIPSYINLPQKSRPFFSGLKLADIEKMHRVSDISALYTAAKQGLSASFSFRHIIEQDLSNGSLIDITPIKTMPLLPVFLVYQSCSYMSQKQRAFIDTFKTAFSS